MQSTLNNLRDTRGRFQKKDTGFMQLFISKRLIHGAAAALAGIFVPIFLYETAGGTFFIVGMYYALLSIVYALLLVPSMHVTNRLGFSRTLVLSGIFSIGTYLILFNTTAENILYLMWPLAVMIVGFRVFHWVPFHTDFALFTTRGKRGKQVSLSFAAIAFMGAVGPIAAGFIIASAGYTALFGTIIVLLLAATISYAYVPETPTHFDWSWKQTWRQFKYKKNRGLMVGEFANGAETIVNIIVWPIFLYTILDGDFFSIGALSTIIVGITIVLQLLLGRYLDGKRGDKARTLKVGTFLYAVGWALKIFVLSAAQVFFVGLYHNIVRIFSHTPFSAIVYDMSADQGSLVDEYTVIREMANHLGRALALIIAAVLTLMIPIEWTFVVAVASSLALNMVYTVKRS
ncbi:MFS transporter [Candidatus Pacebacteria bacterium]|nr:MFS transporter [Candidatus Paceibacterota bacterium]